MVINKQYLVGSKLLGLDNNSDIDYLVLVDDSYGGDFYEYDKQNDIEYHRRTASMLLRTLKFELPFDKKTIRYYVVNYQLDENIIGQDFPYKYSILDNRDKYVEMLNWIVDNKALNFAKIAELNSGNCSKGIYHLAYIMFILENNSPTLTAEQKNIVQKIHDLNMPQSYLDVLEEKIRNLK